MRRYQGRIVEWLTVHGINRFGLTYRLDPDAAATMVGYFVQAVRTAGLLHSPGRTLSTPSSLPACPPPAAGFNRDTEAWWLHFPARRIGERRSLAKLEDTTSEDSH